MINKIKFKKQENSVHYYTKKFKKIKDSEYYDFFLKYMISDYNDFIAIRKKELNIESNLSKFFLSSYSFSINNKIDKNNFNNLHLILNQSYLFFNESHKFKNNPFSDYFHKNKHELFCTEYYLSKREFNILKKLWKPYIEKIKESL